MEFEKISSPSLRELFVQQLEQMILSGKLPVGEKLPPEMTSDSAEKFLLSERFPKSGRVCSIVLKDTSLDFNYLKLFHSFTSPSNLVIPEDCYYFIIIYSACVFVNLSAYFG